MISLSRKLACSVLLLLAAAGCARQKEALPPPSSGAAPVTASEPAPDPRAILLGMARFLGNSPRFGFQVRAAYDTFQESGQKIEYGEMIQVVLSRPNGLRVEVEESNGDRHLVLYDGKEVTAFHPAQNVYAQASKPGGIDAAITHFVQDLHMKLPLAVLLLSRAEDELARRTRSLDYVEMTGIYGVPAHHLAGRTDTVDYQVWIAEGGQPWPLRVVLTYRNAEGQPQFRAQFSDWNLAPAVEESRFAFTPPLGARKISFLAQLPGAESAPGQTTPETGGQP